MSVYIEYVILDNLIIDYILLLATLKITRLTAKRYRILLSSIIGTIFAVVTPYIKVNSFLLLLIKIIISLIMIGTLAKYKNFKSYLLTNLIFIILTFSLGGGLIGLYYLKDGTFKDLNSMTSLENFPIGLIIIGAFLVVKFAKLVMIILHKERDISPYERMVKLINKERAVKVKGFIDTGNNLYDGQNNPVSICSREIVYKLIDICGKKKTNGKYISVSTINGENRILIFKIDKMEIYNRDELNIIENVTIGISPKNNLGKFDIILNPAIM